MQQHHVDVTGSMHAAGQRHFDVSRPARTSDENQIAATVGDRGVGGQQIREADALIPDTARSVTCIGGSNDARRGRPGPETEHDGAALCDAARGTLVTPT